MGSPGDTTELLLALRSGDRRAHDRLVTKLYGELHAIAHRELSRRQGAELRATALLHEAYLKLVDQARVDVEDRAHYLAVAARAMRHILIDHARNQGRHKRGGDWRRVTLDEELVVAEDRLGDLIELDDALRRLERFDQRLGRVVERDSRFKKAFVARGEERRGGCGESEAWRGGALGEWSPAETRPRPASRAGPSR